MDNSLYISLSRQTALMRHLDMTANNLANMNTPAYKSSDPLFTQYLNRSTKPDSMLGERVAYTHDFGIVRNLMDGALHATDNSLDFAIHGEGYFTVENTEGERFYTRNGHFKLDSDGKIVTTGGLTLLDSNGNPFFIAPNEKEVMLTKDGTLSTENGVLGRLGLVEFEDRAKMAEMYSGLYLPHEGNEPRPWENVTVEQHMLEQSNVQPVVEMTKMIALQRAFEAVNRMIEGEGEREKKMMDAVVRKGAA